LEQNVNDACGSSKAKAKSMLAKFNQIDKDVVFNMIEFLTPFEAHSRKLQGKTYPTLPYVVLAQTQFLQHCSYRQGDNDLMRAVKKKAKCLLQETIQIKMEHMIAVFLWPSYKDLTLYPFLQDRIDEVIKF